MLKCELKPATEWTEEELEGFRTEKKIKFKGVIDKFIPLPTKLIHKEMISKMQIKDSVTFTTEKEARNFCRSMYRAGMIPVRKKEQIHGVHRVWRIK